MITYELAVILGLIIEVIYIIISLFLKNSVKIIGGTGSLENPYKLVI